MESFFAYSQSTALNHHQFPHQLTDIHDRMFSTRAITQRYRLFVIILDAIYHHGFIFTYLHSLITTSKTNDVRFLILCPGSKDQLMGQLPKKQQPLTGDMIYWVVSVNLAKQLQVYRTYEVYCGPFLLEVHPNGYWQLVRHIDGPMDWLTWSLVSNRQECEQRAKMTVKTSQAILAHLLVIKKRRLLTSKPTRSSSPAKWGWSMCPLEIKYAILDEMTSIADIMQCVQAAHEDDGILIMTWLIQRLEMHQRILVQYRQLPVKLLEEHERQLSWLLFQLQPYLTSSSSPVAHTL